MRSVASRPAPARPLPLRMATLPPRLTAPVPSPAAPPLAAPPSPVVARMVPEVLSTTSPSVGGRPASTRFIMAFHSAVLFTSYQTPSTYSEVVGSMAE